MTNDPISDFLTRIRNAGAAGHPTTSMPNSKQKVELARVLQEAGYIDGFALSDGLGAGTLTVKLRYSGGKHVITGIRRESRPGQRRYLAAGDIPKVLNGLGIAVVTTSKGVMTGRAASSEGIGGEYICSVW
ncbi:MAG: 30S ribosomal protein S8 [Myxococcales bacterium]|nr:30S ribosomal protein S8 [Myxococcales bacterium]MCB9519907.1 30S ribosomal protein S8 [Myxococcales bacterium]MCB9533186.1 30S ribosomal protein S8 [Myxococcales bacterium]